VLLRGYRIGVLLKRNQFDIGAIGEAGDGHFGHVIGMGTPVFNMQSELFEPGLHGRQFRTADGDMVDAQRSPGGAKREY